MNIRDKLKIYELSKIEKTSTRSNKYTELEKLLIGQEIENTYGRFFLKTQTIPHHYQHGFQSLFDIQNIPSSVYTWIGKDEELKAFDPRKTLYLDTETTGLAGGTGTVPFMIGIGYYENSGFTIEQYFMRDYSEERSMLEAIRNKTSNFESIVTYNGKCYDISLLCSRFILNRMSNPFIRMPHLDLLFTMRRLYKRRLVDCSLSNIEQKILGFTRLNDVPGFMIPDLYFRYLRSGNTQDLVKVFNHNQLDILTLASLTVHSGLVYHNPASVLEHDTDWLSLGRTFESLGLLDHAIDCYETVLQTSHDSVMHAEVSFWLALIYKRIECWDKATVLWEEMIQTGQFDIHPYEELAKYYEHQSHELDKAIDFVQKALKRIQIQYQLHPEFPMENDQQELVYRLDRLKRKYKMLR